MNSTPHHTSRGAAAFAGLALALAPGLAAAKPNPAARAEATAAAATATRILTANDLIGGPAATGRAQQGDILLQNDHIRVVIRGPGRTVSAAMFGGHIIDADLRRAPGEAGRDQFGQLSTFINLSSTLNATTVEPITSGLEPGYAGVRACGPSDLFDFVDLENAFAMIPPMLRLIPYEFDTPVPLSLCNTFTLGPNDSFVKIVTDMTNDTNSNQWVLVGDLMDSGSDVEYWLKNEGAESYGLLQDRWTWGGFGLQPFGFLELMGYFGDGVSYGYVAPLNDGKADGLAMNIAGVTASVIGTTSLLGTLTGSKKDLLRVSANGNRKYTRYFLVGEDIGAVTSEAFRLQGVGTSHITGTVIDQTNGQPLAGARVTALRDGSIRKPVTQFTTDAQGHFEGDLPPATYGLIAAQGFDQLGLTRAPLLTPVMVTVPSSGAVDTTIPLGGSATLRLTVLDGNDLSGAQDLPVRVSIYDPTYRPSGGGDGLVPSQNRDPLGLIMDVTDDVLREGLIKEVMLSHSPTDIALPPGTWDIVLTRGPEYDRVQVRKTFAAGQVTTVQGVLTQVVDSAGFLSADLHVHAMNSPDSPVDNGTRVATFASDGVDLLVSTDHDFITDFQPIIEAMGLEHRLSSLPGLEMSTFSVGHYNAFPITPDLSHRIGGALDWADNDYVCDVGQDTSLPSGRDNLTPVQFLDALDACYEGEQLRQLNHVRGELQGYFTTIGMDLSALGTAAETHADPTTFRMAEGSDLFEPDTFEAFEVLNEYGFDLAPTLLSDAFALNNLGYPKALTAVSDTHYVTHVPAGNTRTWLKMEVDDPAVLNQDPTYADQFVQSLGALHATASSGPFLTVEASRVGSSARVGMGDTLLAPGGSINLHLRIQHPRWMNFETVAIFANTPVQASYDVHAYPSIADLGPVKSWTLPDPNFIAQDVTVPSLSAANTGRLEFEHSQRLDLTEDTWIVVALWGGNVNINATTGDVWPSMAFSSPIFIDVDGNGRFDAPCGPATYNPAQGCDLVSPPSGSWDERSKDSNHHTQWVDDLWRIVQLEMAPSP